MPTVLENPSIRTEMLPDTERLADALMNALDPDPKNDLKDSSGRDPNYRGSIRLRRGHRVFVTDGTSVWAATEKDFRPDIYDPTRGSSRTLIIRPGLLYTAALNRRNAVKKWLREGLLVPSKSDPQAGGSNTASDDSLPLNSPDHA